MFRENTKHEQESLLDTSTWMDKSVKEKLGKSWAPIFYENVFSKIDESPFAVLYSENGAPNAPVNTLMSLEIMKQMYNMTDIELMERYHFDYLINVAIGQRTLGEDTISERTLYNFRERLYKHTMEHPESETLMFGQFKNLLGVFTEKTGQKMDAQRIDTTMFMSNIKKSGRISLAYDVLVKSVRAIPEESRSDRLQAVLMPSFKTNILYKSKTSEAGDRLSQLLRLGAEALDILNAMPEDNARDERRILTRLLDEQGKPDINGDINAKGKKEISSGSLQSAHDEDATYRIKAGESQSGYVLEITETCSKGNDVQLITDYNVAPNTTADVDIVKDRMPAISAAGCKDLYGDGGFYGEDVIERAAEEGITIHYTDMTGIEPKKLSASDFKMNETGNKIEGCPGGLEPTRTGECKTQVTAHFDKSACEACPLREQCPGKANKNDVTVRIPKKSIEAAKQRDAIKRDCAVNTSYRAGIEGTNHALKQKGLGKLKVRGLAKCKVVCGLKVIAQNVSRFINYMQGKYKHKFDKSPTKGELCPIQ